MKKNFTKKNVYKTKIYRKNFHRRKEMYKNCISKKFEFLLRKKMLRTEIPIHKSQPFTSSDMSLMLIKDILIRKFELAKNGILRFEKKKKFQQRSLRKKFETNF